MPFMRVPGARIHYVVEGAGEPLLMIRGYGSHLGWWEPSFRRALAERFSLILYDHRGTGESVHEGGDYTVAVLANDAVALLRGLGIGKARVFGLSMGGMVAQEIALREPELVDTLVLGATHCGGDKAVPPEPEVMRILLARAELASGSELPAEWVDAVFTPGYAREDPEAVAAYLERAAALPTPPEIVRLQALAVAAFDSWERLPSIAVPTWILHGERDAIVPPRNALVLESRIPFARAVFLPGTGHDFTAQNPRYAAWLLIGMLCCDSWNR